MYFKILNFFQIIFIYWYLKNINGEQIKYIKIDENQSFAKNIPNNIDEPYDFFKLIFTDSYINQIVINSNEYKEKKKKNIMKKIMI